MNTLALKAMLGNSKRSIHVIVATAFSVAIIFSCYTVTNSFLVKAGSFTEGYTATSIFYLVDPNKPLSEASLNPDLVERLPTYVTAVPAKYLQLEAYGAPGSYLETWFLNISEYVAARNPRVRGSIPASPEEVLIGATMAINHGVSQGNIVEVKKGDAIYRLLVTGIIYTSTQFDEGIVASYDTAQLLGEPGKGVSLFELTVVEPSIFRDDIVVVDLGGALVVESKAMQAYIDNVTAEIQLDLLIVSVAVSTLALMAVFHAMYKIVSDSVNEILILRSLGLTRRGTLIVILVSSLILSIAGALIGIIVGLLLSNSASIFVYLLVKRVYLPITLDMRLAFSCVGMSIMVGLLGGSLAYFMKRPGHDAYGVGKTL